jgi:hypothetical protein
MFMAACRLSCKRSLSACEQSGKHSVHLYPLQDMRPQHQCYQKVPRLLKLTTSNKRGVMTVGLYPSPTWTSHKVCCPHQAHQVWSCQLLVQVSQNTPAVGRLSWRGSLMLLLLLLLLLSQGFSDVFGLIITISWGSCSSCDTQCGPERVDDKAGTSCWCAGRHP